MRSMKSKAKKKTKNDLPSMDFVTALSIEECRRRIRALSKPDRAAKLEDAHHFTATWLLADTANSSKPVPSWDKSLDQKLVQEWSTISLSYWGTLAERNNGTHVQLVPIPQELRSPYHQLFVNMIRPSFIGIIVLALLMLLHIIPEEFGFLIFMIVMLNIGVIFEAIKSGAPPQFDRQLIFPKNAKWLLEWVHDGLYVPPQASAEDDKTKSQAENQA